MLLSSQKDQFSLPPDVCYLNCATMSPLSKGVEAAGLQGVLRKSQPYQITQEVFFEELPVAKRLAAQLINCPDAERMALIPSVSYGMATVAKNLAAKPALRRGQHILVIQEEFPSDLYAWDEICATHGLKIKTVACPESLEYRAEIWNNRIVEAIAHDTCMVVLPMTHWTDGTLFDLLRIGQAARQHGALFVIDGTQSVGAMPFDVQKVQPDALICAGYKTLMGPYATGFAYYGEYFDTGTPIEQNWINREGSNEFRTLVNYQSNYRSKAFRYNVGETSNFILLPMMIRALEEIIDRNPEHIQTYLRGITQKPLETLQNKGFGIEKEGFRGHHLFGLYAPKGTDIAKIQQNLAAQKIYVSIRGSSIRVAPNVYNDEADVWKLVEALGL